MGRNNRDEFQLNGLLDRGCSFEGKLMFDGTVQINGDFKGEVLSDGTLVVGAEANINAKIHVDTIIIDGNVQGIIEAKKKVEMHRGSRLVANIISPSLVIEEGALFEGQCHMMEGAANVDSTTRTTVRAPQMANEEGEDSLMM
jgi:cytoskeletal protein CcmA (bactofilin family)